MQAGEGGLPIDVSPGRSLIARFETFSVRLDLTSATMLHLEIIDGDDKGFSDDVAYELRRLRSDLVMLSWQESIGTTVTHVADLALARTHATVTPARGGFLRLEGRLVQA